MIKTTLTKKALRFAKEYHKNDIDECGKPVMERLLYVAERMEDEVTTCAALLQNIDLLKKDLSYNLFSEYPAKIADTITILNYDEYFYFDYLEDPYDIYIRDVMTNEAAQKVMLEDLRYRINLQNYNLLTADLLQKIQMYKKAFNRINGKIQCRDISKTKYETKNAIQTNRVLRNNNIG